MNIAVVNDDGLWIKEEVDNNIFIIHAENLIKINSNTNNYWNGQILQK